MTEPTWVLPELALAVHQMLIAEHGGLAGVRDHDLLESALARPRQLFSYGEAELGLVSCFLMERPDQYLS